ncbi:MAG: PH domain-containing protein [Candidatus Woesearchaeota archaeon]|nr:PH domain-containing protein [Candidatus Woesearchaeota archaeon]
MRELDKILDKNEKTLWEGAPKFWPYLFSSSIITTLFGLFWMLFLIPFIILALLDITFGSHIFGFGIVLLPHFWIGIFLVIGIPLYLILVHKYTYYAITDKRVIIQKGLIGRDFEIVDFDQITNAEVNVGFFDTLFGGNSGTILIASAGSMTYTRQGVSRPYTLRNILKPYEVFKLFKEISHAVKTDIEYPNKYRPKTNPGYKTKYVR